MQRWGQAPRTGGVRRREGICGDLLCVTLSQKNIHAWALLPMCAQAPSCDISHLPPFWQRSDTPGYSQHIPEPPVGRITWSAGKAGSCPSSPSPVCPADPERGLPRREFERGACQGRRGQARVHLEHRSINASPLSRACWQRFSWFVSQAVKARRVTLALNGRSGMGGKELCFL